MPVIMDMMKVQCMRVTVHHIFVRMQVGMFPFHQWIVNVRVMFIIVAVPVFVNQRRMDMPVAAK